MSHTFRRSDRCQRLPVLGGEWSYPDSLVPASPSDYSTVTDLARLRGLSTSRPKASARVRAQDLQRNDALERAPRCDDAAQHGHGAPDRTDADDASTASLDLGDVGGQLGVGVIDATTGVPVPISARGPCLSSPAG